jgi:hypothetical protein
LAAATDLSISTTAAAASLMLTRCRGHGRFDDTAGAPMLSIDDSLRMLVGVEYDRTLPAHLDRGIWL